MFDRRAIELTSPFSFKDAAVQHFVYRLNSTYTTDANGNRTNAGFAPATDSNRLQSDGVYDYQYDAEGNVTRQTKIADGSYSVLDWDQRNRLISVTNYDVGSHDQYSVANAYDLFDVYLSWPAIELLV